MFGITKYNKQNDQWEDVSGGVVSLNGQNDHGIVHDIKFVKDGGQGGNINDELILIGGEFTHVGTGTFRVEAKNIAAYKKSDNTWKTYGTGVGGKVYTVQGDHRGNIFVGGELTTAGCVPTNVTAIWNGITWKNPENYQTSSDPLSLYNQIDSNFPTLTPGSPPQAILGTLLHGVVRTISLIPLPSISSASPSLLPGIGGVSLLRFKGGYLDAAIGAAAEGGRYSNNNVGAGYNVGDIPLTNDIVIINVGGVLCTNVRWEYKYNALSCIAPAGTGTNQPINVTLLNRPAHLFHFSTDVNGDNKLYNELTVDGGTSFWCPGTYSPCVNFSAPIITDILPSRGVAAGNEYIYIYGQHFGGTLIASKNPRVWIGVLECLDTIWINDGKLKCKTPPGAGRNYTMTVNVAGQIYMYTNGFSYDPPIVYSVSPNIAPVSGSSGENGTTILTIMGKNFGTSETSSTLLVTIADVVANQFAITWVSDSVLTLASPIGAGYLGIERHVVVEVKGQNSTDTGNNLFSYYPPQPLSITPFMGLTVGGTTVTIAGLNFGTSSASHFNLTVYFATTNITLLEIDLIEKQLAASVVTVSASTNTRNIQKAAAALKALQRAQDRIQKCTNVNWVSDTELTCVAPPGTGTSIWIQIGLNGHHSSWNPNLFSYSPPTIWNIQPKTGNTIGKYRINITGINFGTYKDIITSNITGTPKYGYKKSANVEKILFGPSECTDILYYTPFVVSCVTPPGIGYNNTLTIIVDRQSSLINSQNIEHATSSTINNNNFNGNNYQNTFNNPISLNINDNDVETISNPFYGAGNTTFSYNKPVVYFISPNLGPESGNTTIKIFGKNFGGNATNIKVKIGNLYANIISTDTINHNVITCITPPGTLKQNIQVSVGFVPPSHIFIKSLNNTGILSSDPYAKISFNDLSTNGVINQITFQRQNLTIIEKNYVQDAINIYNSLIATNSSNATKIFLQFLNLHNILNEESFVLNKHIYFKYYTCDPGYYTPGGTGLSSEFRKHTSKCKKCEKGTYAPYSSMGKCMLCDSWSYQSHTGSTYCEPCPIHARTRNSGSTHISQCLCEQGYYGKPGTQCKKCPKGGICLGGELGTLPLAAPGYSRSHENSSQLLPCLPMQGCVGGIENLIGNITQIHPESQNYIRANAMIGPSTTSGQEFRNIQNKSNCTITCSRELIVDNYCSTECLSEWRLIFFDPAPFNNSANLTNVPTPSPTAAGAEQIPIAEYRRMEVCETSCEAGLLNVFW